jgi:hypothetical protein
MQTVYKWINEEKIKCEEINSPGKQQGKGYRIPKDQFEGEDAADDSAINDIDPTFRSRREKELEKIPNTGFDPGSLILPEDSKAAVNEEEIKKKIFGSKTDES